ncbi:general secretion pathway protein GspB [Franconibacter pulveris]|uniref:general secretion pathway protein GspB n=1 Tax=Franconibacter pulveris TaxID=435910 RepID=UPI00049728B5|nr:general secretion pathway protein GspB [Franconibacter pulveris]
MSEIITAAYESVQTNQRVRLSRRRRVKSAALALLALGAGAVAAGVGGSYLHLYWNFRNPPPAPVVKAEQPETFISDVHYVYTTKALPTTQPQVDELKNALFARSPLQNPPVTPPQSEPLFQESALTLPPDGGADAAKLREKLAMALREQSREFNSDVPPGAMDATHTQEEREPDQARDDDQAVLRQRLPYLKYQQHMYSSDGVNSRVKLNNHLYKEGDSLARNVVISKIATDKLIVNIDGKPYSLPSLKDWKP